MSKPIIFNLKTKKVIPSVSFDYEKELQKIIEDNMENIFGVRFLKSEYQFSDTNDGNGRIDSLGIDQENRPVIFEYKLSQNENVINQALYYMSWLKNHRGDFEMLVLEKFGKQIKDTIQWKPRAICVANEFDKYSDKAVSSVGADVTLIKYYLFGKDNELIAFESTNNVSNNFNIKKDLELNCYSENQNTKNSDHSDRYFTNVYNNLSQDKKNFIDFICDELINISEEITTTTFAMHQSFRRIKIFASLVIKKSGACDIFLPISYSNEMKNNALIYNVENKGHWGKGDVKLTVSSTDEFNDIFKYIKMSFELN